MSEELCYGSFIVKKIEKISVFSIFWFNLLHSQEPVFIHHLGKGR